MTALLTALVWRERDYYDGDWVFYASHRRRRERDEPYRNTSFLKMLGFVEERAGVPHIELRGAHGLRRMVAGEVLQETRISASGRST